MTVASNVSNNRFTDPEKELLFYIFKVLTEADYEEYDIHCVAR
jgi:hypothetical protein